MALNKNNSQQANQNPPGTTSNGGVAQNPGGLPEQPVFQIHTDNSQPYAVNEPRSNEPAQQPPAQANNPQANQNQIAAAVAAGVLPDASGNYVQHIDNSGVNQFDVSQYNYSLPDNQFLQTYYPDSSEVISGSTPTDLALNAQDPVLVSNSADTGSLSSDTIPVDNSVDPSELNVSSDNSDAAIGNYIQDLAANTSSYDLVDNPSLLSGIANNATSQNDLKSAGTTVSNIVSMLKKQPVPSKLLGLHQSYVAMYEHLGASIGDEIRLQNDKNAASLNADAQTLQNDISDFTNSYSAVDNDLGAVQNNFGVSQ